MHRFGINTLVIGMIPEILIQIELFGCLVELLTAVLGKLIQLHHLSHQSTLHPIHQQFLFFIHPFNISSTTILTIPSMVSPSNPSTSPSYNQHLNVTQQSVFQLLLYPVRLPIHHLAHPQLLYLFHRIYPH